MSENNHPNTLVALVSSVILEIPLHQIRAFEGQPRTFFNPVTLRELADSIAEVGQVTPGKVRKLIPPVGEFLYELTDGERRIRACLMAGKSFFRAEIDTTIANTDEQFEKSVTANFNREGHTVLETIYAIQRLKEKNKKTDEQISRIMGYGVQTIRQYYSLLKLQPDVLKFLDPNITPQDRQITLSIALMLVGVPEDYQLEFAKDISARQLSNKAARHLIEKTLHGKGIVRKNRKPGKEFDIFASFVERIKDQLELNADCADNQLREIIFGGDLQKRMKMFEGLESSLRILSELKDRIEELMKKGKNP